MKRCIIALFAGVLLPLGVTGQTREAVVRAMNSARVGRQSETVEVPLRELLPLIGDARGGEIVVSARGSGKELLSQLTEAALLFQSDIGAGQTAEFSVRRGSHPAPKPVSLVDGRYVLPREDYAWENDRIAFRMYGPALAKEVNNGIDVWTKRVRSLIVAKWYREADGAPPGKDPYHHDRGEGADFFDVGRSLGAGGCALWSGGRVHQPGVFTSWKTIASGPLRVEFELTYAPVTLGSSAFTQRTRIALDAGMNLNRVRVTFETPQKGKELEVACGLVRRAGVSPAKDVGAVWMGLWGPTNSDPANGSLGTGVVFPRPAFVAIAADSVQEILVGRVVAGEPLTYYAGAGWTRSGDFASRDDWNAYLADRAVRLANPLRVEVVPGNQ